MLQTLLAGDHPILAHLREQATDVVVKGRNHTTVGEYIDLEVAPRHAVVEPPNIVLSDIHVEVEGVKHGVAALLFVIDGKLGFIEFATAADTWPENPLVRGVKYFREVETAPGSYALEPAPHRDNATLQRALEGRPTQSAV